MYRGSPNIEMDEHTFMVNRERAVDYLNSLDKVRTFSFFLFFLIFLKNFTGRQKNVLIVTSFCHPQVFVNDQFLNWDPEYRIKVRIVSARAYHSLFMHNM